MFQSPSLRGSGRFLGEVLSLADSFIVSIPFIAGQWSLPASCFARSSASRFQSPSLRGSGRFTVCSGSTSGNTTCFNPLHCGAVVASRCVRGPRVEIRHVSIPFIAGQWSLRDRPPPHGGGAGRFQSPSLRGSGRFVSPSKTKNKKTAKFQSPSLRGSGRFPCSRRARANPPAGVSIPFIAGQWSLRGTPGASTLRPPTFQSPSLRGSGRFSVMRRPTTRRRRVSIPFIAGQWSLR